MAPRSDFVLRQAFAVALLLRRYAEAADVLARERALDPAAPRVEAATALLAGAAGDSAAVARALRGYRAAGGRWRAGSVPTIAVLRPPFQLLRFADRALGDTLLAGTPAAFGAQSGDDTLRVDEEQAQLLLIRGDAVHAGALVARGLPLARRLYAAAANPDRRGTLALPLAWFAAARGDGGTARAALDAYSTASDAELRALPDGSKSAALTCTRAEVAGLLGDVAGLLPPLRRCLTMPGGFPVAFLRTEPAFARHRADLRLRALAAELAAPRARGAAR
ncbi:hypothetical protein tb265_05780 [Gemmatimonadetes bacterium T265]|nr:hypothetical protein tb265_05780 [Gemmatimonadetes bacterium T265]